MAVDARVLHTTRCSTRELILGLSFPQKTYFANGGGGKIEGKGHVAKWTVQDGSNLSIKLG